MLGVSCDSLWIGTLAENPANCVINAALCTASQRCNPSSEVCEDLPLALQSVSPALAPRTASTLLTLHGTGFVPGMTAEIGGAPVAAKNLTVLSATELQLYAPPAAKRCGLTEITLRRPEGVSVTRADLFRYYLPELLFNTAQDIPISPVTVFSYFVDIADMNHDGNRDIVVALNVPMDPTQSKMGVMLGHGDGTFDAIKTEPTGQTVFSFALQDWDRDGNLDVLTGSLQGSVAWLRGVGDGSLVRAQPNFTPKASSVRSVLNLDLGPDLPATTIGLGPTLVRLQNVGGQFQELAGPAIPPFGQLPALGDINRDGIADIVQTYYDTTKAPDVFLGKGAGLFNPGTPLPLAAAFTQATIGDINGDGWPDVLAGSQQSGFLAVFLNRGDGSFAEPRTYPNNYCRVVQLADLNCDGSLDVVAANERAGYGTIWLNLGDGTFGTSQSIKLQQQNFSTAVADLNGDQAPDLVFAEVSTLAISVVLSVF